MASGMRKMREEATCSICLQLMREPVSINCGHSFCRRCIEGIGGNHSHLISSALSFSCPLCRASFKRESLRPNKQLENLIESIKEMECYLLCEEHGIQLHLFCMDDEQLVCWHCQWSPQHRGHSMAPMKDIVPGYKLQESVKNLKKQEDSSKNMKLSTRELMKQENKNRSFSGRVKYSAPSSNKLREEALCSICQQLMTEPVSINCGHSFCRQCIEDNLRNQRHITAWLGKFYCSQCTAPFTRASIRRNMQLESLLGYISTLCEEHGEHLLMFCEDDKQLLCWKCERSPQHEGHNTVPVEDACQKCKEELQDIVVKLTALQDQCMGWTCITREQIEEWQEKTELQRQKIECDFEKLFIFLYEKKKFYLERLEEEKNHTLKQLQASEASLAKQSNALDTLILELEKKCQDSAQQLLQDVKDTLSRGSAMKLEVPKAVSLELRNECSFSKIYSEMKEKFLPPGGDSSVVEHRVDEGQSGVSLGPRLTGPDSPSGWQPASRACFVPQSQRRVPTHYRCRRVLRPVSEQNSPTARSAHSAGSFSRGDPTSIVQSTTPGSSVRAAIPSRHPVDPTSD